VRFVDAHVWFFFGGCFLMIKVLARTCASFVTCDGLTKKRCTLYYKIRKGETRTRTDQERKNYYYSSFMMIIYIYIPN